jgi:glycosyltransferase involved in cell wall biosynthesis
MKISIFAAFYPFRGGIAQFNAQLFRSLEKKHQVTAFTFKKQYPDFLFPGTSQFVDSADSVDQIPAKRIVSTFNPFTYFSAARSIRNSSPDIFITNYWMSFFGLFMGVMARRQSKKTTKIAILHNLVPHEKRFFDFWLNRFFVNRFDAFIVMSESVEDELKILKPSAKFIRLNHPWYNHFGELLDRTEARKTLEIHPDKKTILFFGLIREYKGLDLLIEAFSQLSDSYQLLIAGEIYGNEEHYLTQIRSSKAVDRIHFFNRYIPNAEVSLFFSASDVCVLPYRSATQSGITAASFHFEVPIIATNVGGLKEIIGEDKLGIIVAEPKVDLLQAALVRFFEENLSGKFKQNIKAEKKNNSWSKFAESLVLFAETCSRNQNE